MSVLSGVDRDKQLVCAHSSLILANNFAPVSEALAFKESTVPEMPAFCDNCGAIFGSGFVFDNCTNISLSGNKVGPCPNCGATGSVPDRVYDITGNAIKLISGTLKTVEQIKALSVILTNAQKNNQTREEVDEQIQKETPELSSFASILPKTRVELYAFITIILMAIGLMITSSSNDSLSEDDVEQMIERAIQQSMQPQTNFKTLPYSPKKKQGRNEQCNCNSGKKFKRCCINSI